MKKLFTTLMLMVAFCIVGFSQGQYDVRFDLNTLDCDGEQFLLNIDVRASAPDATFTIAEQNYRFSFNRAALVPGNTTISREGELSSFILDNGVLVALYSEHNLGGSLDTIISYNLELSGGEGVLVEGAWVNVGTLAFQVADIDACLDMTWHDSTIFPPTFVSTFDGGSRQEVIEGEYLNDLTFSCFSDICAEALPVELTSFDAVDGEDCSIELTWKTATETNNAYFMKQVDLDGLATTGSQLIVRSACFEDGVVNTIEVFPNPVRNRGSVKFYNTNLGDTEVELHFNTSKLIPGTYYVQLKGNNWLSASEKIVKMD